MRLTECLTRRVVLSFGGKSCRLLFPHFVLLEIEEETGLQLLQGELDPLHLSAKVLRVVLYVLLKRAGASYSLAEVGKGIRITELAAIRMAVADAWCASMPDPEESPDSKGKSRINTWLDAWALADQELQLTPDEWLDMTPRMVHALSREHLEMTRQREYMLSKVASAGVNFGACRPKEPLPDDAWMIHPWPKPEEEAGEIGDQIMREMRKFKR